jgi:endonuclease/exonuclease/phosphatase family metal-dependent hydrolase
VLREIDADVIGLQEVLSGHVPHTRNDQAGYLASELGMNLSFGRVRDHAGLDYGNAVLSRLPIVDSDYLDISVGRYEPRGCMQAVLAIDEERSFRFLNLHMGTSYFERRKQIDTLLSNRILESALMQTGTIIAGDMNEWTKGLTTRKLRSRLNDVDPKQHIGRSRTFPGLLPLFHLDHIYFDDMFVLKSAALHRTRKSILASDHLPFYADFEIAAGGPSAGALLTQRRR